MSGKFGEPWFIDQSIIQRMEGANKRCVGTINNEAHQERAVACVNACSGMVDPSAITKLVDAATEILRYREDYPEGNWRWEELESALDAIKQEGDK